MIISHKHQFIFIKTRKTAGTSLEVALERHCGPDDIVTPIWPAVATHRPRNFSNLRNHSTAAEAKSYLSESEWDSYFKIAFDRNPWDKVVSMYWWRVHTGHYSGDITEFIIQGDGIHFGDILLPTDYAMYTENNRPVVDYLGRFESLQHDYLEICDRIGIKHYPLTSEKSAIRRSSDHYSRYYNQDTQEIVHRNFSREIELFGYQFEASGITVTARP